jgi:hypothetical protein
MRRLKMSDELMEKYKYPALTDEIKNQILGLNAAKVFGIDVQGELKKIKTDKLTQIRNEFRRQPAPSNTQYGWIWIEDGRTPTVPVGTV